MSLKEILEHRRAVRCYDSAQPIDAERVKACIELATLAPSSSNMQLWECYHITDKNVLTAMGRACLSQQSATTAQQLVVFVTRQDLYRKHDKRSRRWAMYYGMVIPFLYARCFGLLGLVRKALAQCVGLFRPITRQVSESDTRVVVHKRCALAAQTFMLAMSEAGYDTCPLEGFDSWRIKRLLHLPCGTEINMVVSCGIRLPKGVWGDRYRQPFDQTYHRI